MLIYEVINWIFLVFTIAVSSSYVFLAVLSILEIRSYKHNNHFVDYYELLNSKFAPSISVIAPAYNEGLTIVENIKSLLSFHYPDFRIIVVNDGSKDNTLEKVIQHYNLRKVRFHYDQKIETNKVRGVYKSKNPAYNKLLVIDKHNGGKADALNVGLNVSMTDYVACIDVDCMLSEDALLKMVKPFIEDSKEEMIAAGGIIKVANSCDIMGGKLITPRIPESLLPRFQILEYIRAFFMGRMAWSRLNGLLLISGAFGVFDRKIALSAGGYNPKTVGEDMELVVRMRRYMEDNKRKYRVGFIPDSLCWTEVPETKKILASQRNRWTRGTIETLLLHRKMFFNPRYRITGMLSYPYWFFFEWLAPILEFVGLVYFAFLWMFADIYWLFFFLLLLAVYLFAVMFTTFSLLIEELNYNEYPKSKDMIKLVLTAILEPITFHPFIVWAAIKGNWAKLTGKKLKWGQMQRKGFVTAQ